MAELQISNENLNQAHKYLNIILKINPNHNHALLVRMLDLIEQLG